MSDPRKTGIRILNFSFTKISIGLIVCITVVTIGQIVLKQLPDIVFIGNNFTNLVSSSLSVLLILSSYSILYSFYEKRKITELSTNKLTTNLFIGIIIGITLQSLTILVIYFNNGLTIVSINPVFLIIPSFTNSITAAIIEETIFRGIIFRLTEEKLGSYNALLISALIFGALHLANPNSSPSAALGIAIQAGLLLGAAYMYSRNLWFPIAIHFAWNFTQSGIFGAATSGHLSRHSLLTTKTEGIELITGGQFGPEGSIQATLFCLAVTIILMRRNHKQNKIIKPYWNAKVISSDNNTE